MKTSRNKYLKMANPAALLRTRKVLQQNPTIAQADKQQGVPHLSLFQFNHQKCIYEPSLNVDAIANTILNPTYITWINLDVINTPIVEKIGKYLDLHPLVVEDILSRNQRPKLDILDQCLICVLHMLYYNEESDCIESEQVSLLLGKNYLISFQDDAIKDLFNPIREKLQIEQTRVRLYQADYLLYALIDVIVDNYFIVLDKVAIQIEKLEEELTQNKSDSFTMNRINDLRKELMIFRRSASPVREVIGAILRAESDLIEEKHLKYFKDIYDHIIQANDLCETYRDLVMNLRDLYLSQMNLRMNEIMKFLAIVTTLMAPATVIGGIFGMNFDSIPYIHHQNGFWIATILMIVIPVGMLFYFRGKDWF